MAWSADSSSRQRPRSPRSHHRSNSHATAHANTPQNSPQNSGGECDHPLATHDPPILITQQNQLAELLDHLRAAGSFAFDSEFIGELTYVPKLCLIQAASTKQVALIDPLADLDLNPFWELVADPTVEKIVHAGQQDVEPVFRALNRPPAKLFDTQISAGFIGLGYPLSLSKLVSSFVGVRLSKGLTFTHWDHRPLSDQQLRYAADDVRYLPALRHEIGKQLDAAGHTAWAAEESESLADPSLYTFDPETQYLKIRGASALVPRNQAVLKALTVWRDQASQQENIPPRTMLRDEILLDMARQPVLATSGLSRVRGLPRPVEATYGTQLVEVTKTALALPPEECPNAMNYEPTPPEKFRADALCFAVQCLCAGRRIDPNLVACRQEIGDLLLAWRSGTDPSHLRILRGWRNKAVGEHLLALLKGESGFSVRWADDALQTEFARPELNS
jgi:ribonuclease D